MRGAMVSLLLLASVPAQPADRLDSHWVYISRTIAWKTSPIETAPVHSEGGAEIAVFYPDGRFGLVSGIVMKGPGSKALSLCLNCGYCLRTGTWVVDEPGSTLLVKSRWVTGMCRDDLERSESEETWSYTPGKGDRLATRIASPIEELSPLSRFKNWETLQKTLRTQ